MDKIIKRQSVLIFGWLSQRFRKSQKQTEQLQPREFTDESVEQENAPQWVSSDSPRSFLKTSIADSINMSAQKEAEAEAARIIARAQLEAQEIKGRAEIDAQKRAEDIISAANKKAEITEAETKHKALQLLISVGEEVEKEVMEEYKRAYSRLSFSLQDLMNEGRDIEAELKGKVDKLWKRKSFELKEHEARLLSTSEAGVSIIETQPPVETELKPDTAITKKVEKLSQLEKEAVAEKVEEPVQLHKESIVEKVEEPAQLHKESIVEKVGEPVQLHKETIVEKVEEPAQLQHEGIAEKIEEPALLKLDSQDIYTGEVELLIAPLVELKLVTRLYNYLQTVPELKILYTRGSWDQGTTITVVPDKPMPLIDIIAKTPGVEVTAESFEKGGLPMEKSSSLLRSEKKGVKRINLMLKEAQPL